MAGADEYIGPRGGAPTHPPGSPGVICFLVATAGLSAELDSAIPRLAPVLEMRTPEAS